ncbi:hypothetical protein BJ165DRAFT_1598445 [Panaeolus papilionaceus]|nr:hypothetical protein BJ165DRAFT_1598445 [Panaeolus papilionaceus]
MGMRVRRHLCQRWEGVVATTGNLDGAPRIPTEKNPVIVAIYGQICVAVESFQNAIWNDEGEEVEYNFGRTFYQLGLYLHAVKHYEKVLELAEQAGDDLFAREGAFNLSCRLLLLFYFRAP